MVSHMWQKHCSCQGRKRVNLNGALKQWMTVMLQPVMMNAALLGELWGKLHRTAIKSHQDIKSRHGLPSHRNMGCSEGVTFASGCDMSQSIANIQDKKRCIVVDSLYHPYNCVSFSISTLFQSVSPSWVIWSVSQPDKLPCFVRGVTLQEHHRSEFGHSSSSEAQCYQFISGSIFQSN